MLDWLLRRMRCATIAAAALVVCFANAARAVDDPEWKLPPGFTIELVAGSDLVQHPTMGGFDDRGRLYLCDGPGDNLPAKDLLAAPPHSIKRLEDTDGDGRFDRVTVFADKLVFPQGALWHDGSIYTASPPNIWKLTDTDDDGVCDERQVLVSEFGFTGNAADVHGCFLGPEGRIWWCDGRHGHTFTDEHGNTISKGLAARLFSCRPDGSDVQAFAGGGMDNPVEVAFTEEGEPIGTVAIYDNQPDRVDALIHWVYGGVYPYYPKVLDEFKRTGDLLPAVMRYGRVAPAGLLRKRSAAWGTEYVDNFFHVQFNTHRVIRTKLTRDGATFRGEDEEFLVSEHADVHLTDVIEDADGSLLVVDTGGWFRQGCPNSQIAKPEIRGGVYRIRRPGVAGYQDPRGLTLNWEAKQPQELLVHMRSARLAVRDRAAVELSKRGDEAVQILNEVTPGEESLAITAVWILQRIDTPAARTVLRNLTREKVPSVRQTAARALGMLRDEASFAELLQLLSDGDLAVSREAATALGRLKNSEAAPVLLAAFKEAANDRFLEHAIIYALIEINDASATAAGLDDADPNVRRGALIALDQTASELLTRDAVAKLLETDDERLQQAALGVMQRHPDWADGIIDYLRRRLAPAGVPAQGAELLRDTILAYKADPRVQQLLADALADAEVAPAARQWLLAVVERSEFDAATLPQAWAEQIAAHLQSPDEAVVRQAITAVSRVGGGRFDDALRALGDDADRDAALRVAALAALGPRVGTLSMETFLMLMLRRGNETELLDRRAAADVLGRSTLVGPQRAAVVAAVEEAGPLELPPLLDAFVPKGIPQAPVDRNPRVKREEFTDVELEFLLEALAKSPGLDNVPSSLLERIVAGRGDEIAKLAEPLFQRINADIETQRARLTELLPQLAGGDKARGAIVFQMHKTACSSCHRVGVRGTAIGPDLTKVGQIRSLADLVESVLYPSASFVRNYESVAVETADGRVVVGLVSRETPEAVYIRTAQKDEVRIARTDVETLAPSKLSIMPQGLDKIMTLEELKDLVAYLQSLK